MTLNCRPIVEKEDVALSDNLKFILRKKIGDPVGRPYPYRIESYNNAWIEYLKGLFDGGIDDAKKIIDLLEEYGAVEIYEE